MQVLIKLTITKVSSCKICQTIKWSDYIRLSPSPQGEEWTPDCPHRFNWIVTYMADQRNQSAYG